MVPAYCTTASGRVFRLVRSSQLIAQDRVRYVLRAEPISNTEGAPPVELAREIDAEFIRDKIVNRQAVPTPELTFEALWAQLRQDLDARDDG
jgi:hypothetical protein